MVRGGFPKAGAENFLTFGRENKLEGLSIGGKLGFLVWTSPVFVFTALFRVSGLAILLAWAGNSWKPPSSSSSSATISRSLLSSSFWSTS